MTTARELARPLRGNSSLVAVKRCKSSEHGTIEVLFKKYCDLSLTVETTVISTLYNHRVRRGGSWGLGFRGRQVPNKSEKFLLQLCKTCTRLFHFSIFCSLLEEPNKIFDRWGNDPLTPWSRRRLSSTNSPASFSYPRTSQSSTRKKILVA